MILWRSSGLPCKQTKGARRPTACSKFRNTEIFGFAGDLIARTEVYFGWNLP
jgi:hypothetical protein